MPSLILKFKETGDEKPGIQHNIRPTTSQHLLKWIVNLGDFQNLRPAGRKFSFFTQALQHRVRDHTAAATQGRDVDRHSLGLRG